MMSSIPATTDLDSVREQINTIDSELVRLLNRRAELAIEVRKFKPRVLDKDREKQVIDNVLPQASDLLDKKFVQEMFENIMAECRRIQANEYGDDANFE